MTKKFTEIKDAVPGIDNAATVNEILARLREIETQQPAAPQVTPPAPPATAPTP